MILGIEWKKFLVSVLIVYVFIYAGLKLFTMAFFPDFYFGPIHALSIMFLLMSLLSIIEFLRGDKLKDGTILTNAAVILISAVVSNGNTLEVPSYIVKSVSEKLNDGKLTLKIDDDGTKYILKVEIK